MSILKNLVKLNNKLEASWRVVNFAERPIRIDGGWYVAEYVVEGNIDHTPRIVVRNNAGLEQQRLLAGAHAGRNRMLVFLPTGTIVAHSESIQFERLARVSALEGRARTLLICFRYLLDFFSLRAFFKIIALQFQRPFERSSSLLQFYSPELGEDGYLRNVNAWNKYQGFPAGLFRWAGKAKIAVIIEDESQRAALDSMLLPPDAVLLVGAEDSVPKDIDYVIALNKTERLRSSAIIILKRAVKKWPSGLPSLVYTDHDYASDDESSPLLQPAFKPEPSRCYLHCYNYIGPAFMVAADVVRNYSLNQLMSEDTRYRIALRCFDNVDQVLHVSEVLFNSSRTIEPETPEPSGKESPWTNIEWHRVEGPHEHNILTAAQDWTLDKDRCPSVDLVIPTRDGMAVLKPCIDSILAKTSYPNYRVILVDNGSEQAETLAYFEQISADPRVKIVSYPGEFNYSAINNFAIEHGESPFVGLINNDIEVIDGDWLTQIMAWAVQPDVGAVGAKLLFSNGKVQHAGVTVGMGNAAGHIHRLEEGDAPGYQLRCLATQNMMAVTAACLITPRDLFYQLGRLDEANLKVAYNDIDYCLRVEKSGKQLIWTPQAVLYHHESVSRGDDLSDQHIERYFRELEVFQSRWNTKGFVDKYYSRHLRISDEGVYPNIERKRSDKLVAFDA